MTAGERLRFLAGRSGTAAALLQAIGSGTTTGRALVRYSGLPNATAAGHLLTDPVRSVVVRLVSAITQAVTLRSP